MSATRFQRFGHALLALSVLGCETASASARPSRPNRTAAAASSTAALPAPANGTIQRSLFGQPDEPVRRVLGSADIERVTKGSGGRSLAFKLYFENGVAGYFKPEQTFAANWYSEVASYYLDRELGLGRVPPAIGRRIEWARLAPHAGNDEKLKEVVIRKGTVRGSVVYWIPDPPIPVELPRGWEGWLRLDTGNKVSPFQRADDYQRQLKGGAWSPRRAPGSANAAGTNAGQVPAGFRERAAELSDLIVFDYLIANLDRWGGGHTNVRVLGKSEPLIYLDNANGFAPQGKPSRLLENRLTAVQRFRKKTVDALRALDLSALKRRMATDPLAPVLSEKQFAELEQRRQRVLEHVAEMQQRHGSHALAW